MNFRFRLPLLRSYALAALVPIAVPLTQADDWMHWRGPSRDGGWRETGVLESFPTRELTPVRTTNLRGRNRPIAWSHPAYADRSLFARNDSQLICVSLAAIPPQARNAKRFSE
jgi:hypothetical protein